MSRRMRRKDLLEWEQEILAEFPDRSTRRDELELLDRLRGAAGLAVELRFPVIAEDLRGLVNAISSGEVKRA